MESFLKLISVSFVLPMDGGTSGSEMGKRGGGGGAVSASVG